MTYSPTKQPKAGSLMRVADSRAKGSEACTARCCGKRALQGEEGETFIYKNKKRVLNFCLELLIKVAMAVRSHSTACDDGTFMFPKEFIAQGKCKRCVVLKKRYRI